MKKTKLMCIVCMLMVTALCATALAATVGEKNALKSAQNYLNFTFFSYDGLIGQLEYEGYTESECKYAADNCEADWFDQAAGSAHNYMEFTSFSKAGLIDQLLYEGFTEEQANYGASFAYGENPEKPVIIPEVEETTDTANDVKETTGSFIEKLRGTSQTNDDASEDQSKNIEAEADKEVKIDIIKIQEAAQKAEAALEEPSNIEETPAPSVKNTSIYDIDLSGLTYDELINLKSQINLAIWNCEEWQEVTVPQGVWEIGVDIPEGYWTIKMVNDNGWNTWAAITYCSELNETKLDYKSGSKILYQQLSRPGSDYPAPEKIDINLSAGNYLIIEENDMIFTPYAGKSDLGFK